MAEYTLGSKIKAALWRLLKLAIGQLPALIAWLQNNQANPKLVALGLFINATMKLLRDVFPSLSWIPL